MIRGNTVEFWEIHSQKSNNGQSYEFSEECKETERFCQGKTPNALDLGNSRFLNYSSSKHGGNAGIGILSQGKGKRKGERRKGKGKGGKGKKEKKIREET